MAIVFLDRCLQPHSDQLQHRPIDDPHPKAFHQLVLRYRVKVPLQVRIKHCRQSLFEVLAYLARASWAERLGRNPYEQSMKSASKIGSMISSTAVCTTRSRIVGMPSGRWRPSGLGMYTRRTADGAVLLALEAFMDLLHKTLCSTLTGFDLLEGNAIHTAFAFLGSGDPVGAGQYVAPIDPIIQGVKPELRLLLRLQVKLLSQRREFLRQPDRLYVCRLPHINIDDSTVPVVP
jgi:hypothetical protein